MKIKPLLLLVLVFGIFFIRVEGQKTFDYKNIINNIEEEINTADLYDVVSKLVENESRVTGTLNCNYSAYYIKDLLENINISNSYYQNFPYESNTSLNVIGYLDEPTTYSSNILIMAHYDSISTNGPAPGANDNAASVASIIQMLKILTELLNYTSINRNLIVLFTSGEEEGLFGSRAWIQQNPEIVSCLDVVINFDMIGYGSYHTVIGNEDSRWLSNYILETSMMNSIEISDAYVGYPSNGKSDHVNFMNSNIPTVWIFEEDEYYSHMHKPTDTIDKVNFSLVSNCVRLFTLVLYRLLTEETDINSNTILILVVIGAIMFPLIILLIRTNRKRKK
jgi:Zn-dependent M28 family amino/carboxypeptidase